MQLVTEKKCFVHTHVAFEIVKDRKRAIKYEKIHEIQWLIK